MLAFPCVTPALVGSPLHEGRTVVFSHVIPMAGARKVLMRCVSWTGAEQMFGGTRHRGPWEARGGALCCQSFVVIAEAFLFLSRSLGHDLMLTAAVNRRPPPAAPVTGA